MRGAAALQTCLAVLLGFFVAPFQHVHAADGGLIHAHFYEIHSPAETSPSFEADDDDHAAARPLNTFTLLPEAGLAPFVLSPAPVLFAAPPPFFTPVDVVEERGHDPPCLECSIPRAPPF